MLQTLVWIAIIAFAILMSWITRSRLEAYLTPRPCQGRSWIRVFPSASKAEIRAFLSLVGDAFALSRSQQMKLRSEDRVMELYALAYPYPEATPDALELETLARLLIQEHGLDLERIWRDDLTLGALLSLTRRPAA